MTSTSIVTIADNGKGRGGGVLIAIRSNLKSERVDLSAFNDINCVAAKIQSKNMNLFVYTGYIPPKDKSVAIYQRHIDAIKSIVLQPNDKLICPESTGYMTTIYNVTSHQIIIAKKLSVS